MGLVGVLNRGQDKLTPIYCFFIISGILFRLMIFFSDNIHYYQRKTEGTETPKYLFILKKVPNADIAVDNERFVTGNFSSLTLRDLLQIEI